MMVASSGTVAVKMKWLESRYIVEVILAELHEVAGEGRIKDAASRFLTRCGEDGGREDLVLDVVVVNQEFHFGQVKPEVPIWTSRWRCYIGH